MTRPPSEWSLRLFALVLFVFGMLVLSCVNCASSRLVRAGQVAIVATQVADVHSTRVALASGHGREANALMRSAAGDWWTLAAIKLPATAGVWWAARAIERRGHPVVAFALQAAAATAVAIVAGRNYQISGGRR